MNNKTETVVDEQRRTDTNNVAEDTGVSKVGGLAIITKNITKNKKTLFILFIFFVIMVIFGNHIVNTISDKQAPGSVNAGVSKIDNNMPPGIMLHDGLIEEETLTDIIFDNVKKDEKDSVVFAKNNGGNFIAKVIKKDKLITSISPPKINKQIEQIEQIEKNEELFGFFVENKTAINPIKKRPSPYQVQRTPTTGVDSSILQSKLEEYRNLLENIIEPSSDTAGYYDFTEVKNIPAPVVVNNKLTGGVNTNKEKNIKKDIYVGDVFYARLAFNLNTDFKTTVIAHIVSDDKLSDATLIGAMEHNATFDKMVLTFHSIDIDGVTKPFEAIAIDIDSDLAGVADSVDNHYFQRLVMPVLLGGMGKAADLYINQGINQTTPSTSDDVISQTYEGGDKQVIAGLLKGGVDVLKVISSKGENRPITVFKSKKSLLKIIALSSI